MSNTSFFKSKTFKCIAVLLCVLLVSGVLLAICWGFLEVTDEERFNRKIGVIYGGETVTAKAEDLSGKTTKVGSANVQKMWFINEKNDYLVQIASRGNGGDVICWVAISVDDDMTTVEGIRKVLIYSVADAAEYTGNIPAYVYDKFCDEYTDGKVFQFGTEGSGEFIKTGASFTMTAVCNNVNGAVTFVKAYVSGEDIIDPTEGFEYVDYIDFDATSWKNDNGEISYNIVTNGNAQAKAFTLKIKVNKVGGTPTVSEYEIATNGSTAGYGSKMSEAAKNLVGKTLADIEKIFADEEGLGEGAGENLHSGATRSNELCYYAAEFALANYDKCLEADKAAKDEEPGEDEKPGEDGKDYKYAEFIDIKATSWTCENGEVSYNIVTTDNDEPGPFTISVKVKEVDGKIKITAFEIKVNGSTDEDFEDSMSPVLQNMVSKTLEDIEAYLADEGGALHTGATHSNELCFNAAAFALANYDKFIKESEGAKYTKYTDFIDVKATNHTCDNGEVSYTIVTNGNEPADPFTISVKVSKVDGKITITAFELNVNGSTDEEFEDSMSPVLQNMVGKTLEDIEAYLADEGGALHTGATYSNELCFNAAAFALANYEEVTTNE